MLKPEEKLIEMSSKTKSLLFNKLVQIVDERFYFKNEVTRDKVIHTIIESYREPQLLKITGGFATGKTTLARFIQEIGKDFTISEASEQYKTTIDVYAYKHHRKSLVIVEPKAHFNETDPPVIVEMIESPVHHSYYRSADRIFLPEDLKIPEDLKKELQTLFEIYTLGA